jgi:quercetin 2,3-dioxygenase
VLLAHNEELVPVGGGFAAHEHREVEIVTWVLSGRLRHADSTGSVHVVGPGSVARLSAGAGVTHAETAADGAPVRFVQMWLAPDVAGGRPSYDVREVAFDGLSPVVSGLARHASVGVVPVRNGSAALHVGRLGAGDRVGLPDAAYLHVFVTRGAIAVDGVGELAAGDAARLTDTAGVGAAATRDTELLVWEMHASLADLAARVDTAAMGEDGDEAD